jgi:phosphoserine phosphatase
MGIEKDIKLVFVDMEGTIFKKVVKSTHGTAPSSWTYIADLLGPEAKELEEETKKIWNSGGYKSYLEWMDATIDIHRKFNLNKKIFDEAMDVEYWPGVKETFHFFREKGYKTALISGGFKAQADKAQTDLLINYALAGCEYFWDEKGELYHWNLNNSDFEGKVNFMREHIKSAKISSQQCAFIGDGPNDVGLAKEVGLSISFNGCKDLENACMYKIKQSLGKEDFREVIKYFDSNSYKKYMKKL